MKDVFKEIGKRHVGVPHYKPGRNEKLVEQPPVYPELGWKPTGERRKKRGK